MELSNCSNSQSVARYQTELCTKNHLNRILSTIGIGTYLQKDVFHIFHHFINFISILFQCYRISRIIQWNFVSIRIFIAKKLRCPSVECNKGIKYDCTKIQRISKSKLQCWKSRRNDQRSNWYFSFYTILWTRIQNLKSIFQNWWKNLCRYWQLLSIAWWMPWLRLTTRRLW